MAEFVPTAQEVVAMLYFRPGSHAGRLFTLLSVVGELPNSAIHLLGNERVYKAMISKMITRQTIHNSQTDAEMICRLLTMTGKGSAKSVRLYKTALPILNWVHPDAFQYYMDAFRNHKFSGDMAHRERNFRIAETAAMCMNAGVEFRPYFLPELQSREMLRVIPEYPSLYLSRDIKRVSEFEMAKTQFTRMIGAIFTADKCYMVYNTRNSVMKWQGQGEYKALISLTEIARLNANIFEIDSAILFGESDTVALKTIEESEQNKRKAFRFDATYHHIHFVPMNSDGVRLLRILSVPNLNAKLMDLLFEPEERSYDRGRFEYDAYINGVYVLSHLDGDIAKLIRFNGAVSSQPVKAEVLCYQYQVPFLREYLDRSVNIKTIDIDSVESELGLEIGGRYFG